MGEGVSVCGWRCVDCIILSFSVLVTLREETNAEENNVEEKMRNLRMRICPEFAFFNSAFFKLWKRVYLNYEKEYI